MPQIDNNFHSEEAQEIMGRAPSWVVRWGITVIFVILALIKHMNTARQQFFIVFLRS